MFREPDWILVPNQPSESSPNSTLPGPLETRPSLLPKLALKPWMKGSTVSLYLKNAWVVNPASESLLPGKQTVLIEKGRIVSVQSSELSQKANISDGLTVDLNGAFLCPGLIDAHVHVTATPGVMTMAELVRTPQDLITLRSTYVLKEMLFRGFTTVRDCGGAARTTAEAIQEGLIEGPRLFQCGKALSQTGGHGDFSSGISGGNDYGCCGGHSKSLARTVDGVPDVLKATREELKAGADFIKIMCGGGVASETDGIETIQFTAEEIQAITTTCRLMGNKHTTAHAYTNEAIRHAVKNGIKGIEHGNLIDKETAEFMAQNDIFLTPTLACYGIMVRKPFENFLNEEQKRKNAQVMKQGLDALKLAHEAGVIICYGSDLLTSMHALQTEEFTVRNTVLSSSAILKHCTINPAKMLGKSGLLGTISEGAYGDVLVLDVNPLDDITILDRPEDHLQAIIKEGRVIMSRIQELV